MTSLNPCPSCGSKERPRQQWDNYDQNISCSSCGFFTGYCHVNPDAPEVWNKTKEQLVSKTIFCS